MKSQNNTNKSKAERVYNILLDNPDETFNSDTLCKRFNTSFSDNLGSNIVTTILSRLFRSNKVLRTPTQISSGYLYSLRNIKELNNSYDKYLLDPNLDKREILIQLMLKDSFDELRNDHEPALDTYLNTKLTNKYSTSHFKKKATKSFLTSIVAFIMGDGHLRKNKWYSSYFFRERTDAERFKSDFIKHFSKEHISIIKTDYCYACIVCNKSLGLLLEKLGAPAGNKVFQSFKIPDWIYHGPDYIKLAFLKVIYGNEGSKPQDNRWRIQFVLSKNEEHLENLLIFQNQIRTMLNYFGISTSFIQLRKQKGRQFNGRFYIKGKENLHKFYNLLEFSYASEKQQVLESLILKGNSFRSATVR